ncbi:V-type ATP synthase subunit D [Candidatus Bathyarchaeota archaeon]|nr:V-type ATP synthase subunit D [Candidatus Bathyarchaeota archaeon]
MAEGIVDILKKDLDALTLKLFELVKKIPPLRDEMHGTLKEAYDLFVEAEMISGSRKIEEVSLSAQPIDLRIKEGKQKGVLGILFPTLQLIEGSQVSRPRFNLLDTPANLDKSASTIKVALYDIVKLAEIEASVRTLLEIMAIKKRQMNRIQFKILPQLDAAIRYIELILEETERQDAIRVRVLQRKRKERASKHV